MADPDRGNPIQVVLVVLAMIGGGWYFFRNYEIGGLDSISVQAKSSSDTDNSEDGPQSYISYRDESSVLGLGGTVTASPMFNADVAENPFQQTEQAAGDPTRTRRALARSFKNIRIASWALDGFGPTKLANGEARQNITRVVRQFDIVALQQVASIERDLIPRLVDVINEGQNRYDYVIGHPVGPSDRPEQLAFIFDTTRVRVDRSQTYTLADPDDQVSFDPLVAWFRAAKPPADKAWTFSLVNVRIDLARAPSEVAMLPGMLAAVRHDGRGEDDVILAGLFQADDSYLLPTIGGQQVKAAVRNLPTDIFGRYQTSNVLIDTATTNEYLGRGGAYDFLRVFNLNVTQAETVTSQLPVYAEFTAVEGGFLN